MMMQQNADRVRARENEADDDAQALENVKVDYFRRRQIRQFLRGKSIRLLPGSEHTEVLEVPPNLSEAVVAASAAIGAQEIKNETSAVHVVAERLIHSFDQGAAKSDRDAKDQLGKICDKIASPLRLRCDPRSALVRETLGRYCQINAGILNDLLIHNGQGITIHQIATVRFEQCFAKAPKVHNFYRNHSILVMSKELSATMIDRFVAPGAAILGGTTVEPIHGIVKSERANIISGWSGAGKTTLATLPHSPDARKAICIVVTPSEIIKHYADFNNLENAVSTDLREDTAMILTVLAMMNAFGITETFGIDPNIVAHDNILTHDQFTQIQQLLGVTTTLPDDFDVRLVLDEAGSNPILVRTLCSIWGHALRRLLARILNVDPARFFLYIVGTGTESFSQPAPGSFPDRYSITKVSSPFLFPLMLKQARSVSNLPTNIKRRFLRYLFDQMYIRNGSDIEVRVTTHSFRCFTQLVSDNARCAALAIRQIVSLTDQEYFDDSGKLNRDSAPLPFTEKLPCLLETWTMSICYEFIHLNALLEADDPFVEIGNALRIVLTWRSELSANEHSTLVVRYGLLFDTAKTQTGTKEITWDQNRPRYRVSQSIAQLFMSRNGFGSFPRGAVDADFEQIVADHHVLCLMLGIPGNCPATAPPAVSMFGGIKVLGPIHRVVLSKQLTDGVSDTLAQAIVEGKALPQKSDAFTALEKEMEPKWTAMIQAKGAVVIVNGPRAPFADVIVITADRLFLVQVKPYSHSGAEEEFAKMIYSPENIFTRKMLLRCCGNPNAKIVAVIFILSADCVTENCQDVLDQEFDHTWNLNKNPNSTKAVREKFHFATIYIPMITSKCNDALGQYQEGTNSALYPMLTSGLFEPQTPTVVQDSNFTPCS